MNSFRLFIRTMKVMEKRCILYSIAIFFMSTSFALFTVMGSLLMKTVVDMAQTGDTHQMLVMIFGNIFGGIVALLVYRTAAVIYNVEAKRAYGNLCKKLFYHEIRLPYSYYELHHSGDFMSKLSYDLEKTGSIYGSRLRRTISPLLQVIVFLVPMLILSWQVTLCLVAVNSIMFLINGILITPIQNVTKRLSYINGKMTEKLSNLLQGMEQARMYSAGRNTVDEFIRENENYAKASKRKIFYTACLESSNKGFDLLCALAFLLLGIYFVQKQYTTLGALTAIYTLYGNFSNQFLQLGRYLPELIGCLTNAQNIFDFMEEEEEPTCWYAIEEGGEYVKEEQTENIIDIRNVSFSYREDKALLQKFSLAVKMGESVAITGSSGCGKTTLSKLLLGLYPLNAGDIYLQNKSFRNLANAELRRQIAYVPQEPYLFHASIRENIRIGRPNATDEEVIQAAKMAYANDFIIKLEKGYDTDAGERGNRLSGGQRQRVAIARAILKEAPVILLDEATSALDNESEQLVNAALKSLQRQKTIIMIAHRPSTIALADRVVTMK